MVILYQWVCIPHGSLLVPNSLQAYHHVFFSKAVHVTFMIGLAILPHGKVLTVITLPLLPC